jgi:UDP-N-acetylmuramate-alanine ligase
MEFWGAFVETLQQFDTTIIYDIYAAREDLEQLKQQFKKNKDNRHCEE